IISSSLPQYPPPPPSTHTIDTLTYLFLATAILVGANFQTSTFFNSFRFLYAVIAIAITIRNHDIKGTLRYIPVGGLVLCWINVIP
ncbi:MAG TPA: hypothetical protein VIJ92_08350, partial [Ginsengibacter sp.]